MREIIRNNLIDFLDMDLPDGVSRHIDFEQIPGKASIFMGVRRCGKSTYLFQIMDQLIQSGVYKQNILYLNFFDDRLYQLQKDSLELILDAYFSLYPEKKAKERVYCFFDEIQTVVGWETFVDRLMRTEKCEVYLTGSSAHMLSREIATQMRGRALAWEMFPFSLAEFLDSRGVDYQKPWSSRKKLFIQSAFGDYWQSGGFPEVLTLDHRLRIRIHQEYWNAIVFRDIVERHDISHPKAVLDLAHWLVDHVGGLYTINRLTNYLQSLGHSVPKSAITDYLNWFEDAYALFTVRLFDASLSRSNANPKKIYCIDHSLVTSVSSNILVNSGHLLENLVFVSLRRKSSDIYYYKTHTGKEVDFITVDQRSTKRLIQVCETLVDPQTRKRELQALIEAMVEQKIKFGLIITKNEFETIEVAGGQIQILPIWQFCLD